MAQGNAKKIGLDHGDLVGKDDDDHTQYLNDTRHKVGCKVRKSSTQTLTANTTLQLVTFDTVVFDTASMFSDANDSITVTEAGLWLIGADFTFITTAPGANAYGEIFLNNANAMVIERRSSWAVADSLAAIRVHELAANDVLTLKFQPGGAAVGLRGDAANPQVSFAFYAVKIG